MAILRRVEQGRLHGRRPTIADLAYSVSVGRRSPARTCPTLHELVMMSLNRKERQTAAGAAGVFDEGVFQVQLQHIDSRRFQRLDELLVPLIEADDDYFQPVADAPRADQPVAGRKGPWLRREFEDDLAQRQLEIVGRAIDAQDAAIEDADAVRYPLDIGQNVRADQDRAAFALDDLDQRFQKIAADDGVQAKRRIVEDQ